MWGRGGGGGGPKSAKRRRKRNRGTGRPKGAPRELKIATAKKSDARLFTAVQLSASVHIVYSTYTAVGVFSIPYVTSVDACVLSEVLVCMCPSLREAWGCVWYLYRYRICFSLATLIESHKWRRPHLRPQSIQRGSSRLARLGRTTTELTYEPTASPRRALDVPMASGLCTYSHYHPRALSMAICRVVICTAKIL